MKIKDHFRPFFVEPTPKRPTGSKILPPWEIATYVREFFPPPKLEPQAPVHVDTGATAAKVLPDHVDEEDDFVLPVRRVVENIIDNDVVIDKPPADIDVDEDNDNFDIEKMLEKVFAENDKRKLEARNFEFFTSASFNPEPEKLDNSTLMSYSLTSIDPTSTMPLRQTKINGHRRDQRDEVVESGDQSGQPDRKPVPEPVKPESNFGFEESYRDSFYPDKPDASDVFPEKPKESEETMESSKLEAQKVNGAHYDEVARRASYDDVIDRGLFDEEVSRTPDDDEDATLKRSPFDDVTGLTPDDEVTIKRTPFDDISRRSAFDDVTIDELPIFSSPSQVVSDFSDSGNEELNYSNTDDTPMDPLAPSRPQTLLLATRGLNSDALYNYNQVPIDVHISFSSLFH